MIVLFSGLAVLTLAYALFISWCIAGWNKTIRHHHTAVLRPVTFVSIIVPARNEEKNISHCLEDLVGQDYPAELFEIIVSDDSSTDHTVEIINRFIVSHDTIRIRLVRSGNVNGISGFKKKAIEAAVSLAKGELIVNVDADCRTRSRFLSELVSIYENENAALIAAPVFFEPGKTLFSKIQALEFAGLTGIAAGAIGNGKPVMCNGAGLAYSKSVFNNVDGFAGSNTASGDDTQLMHKIAALRPGAVHFAGSKDAIVTTQSNPDMQSLFHQRKRWASKIPVNMSSFTVLIAVVAFLVHAGLFILMPLSFIKVKFLAAFLSALLIKAIPEFILLRKVTTMGGMKKLLWLFLPAQTAYCIYILITGIMSFSGSYTWKGRKIVPANIPAA